MRGSLIAAAVLCVPCGVFGQIYRPPTRAERQANINAAYDRAEANSAARRARTQAESEAASAQSEAARVAFQERRRAEAQEQAEHLAASAREFEERQAREAAEQAAREAQFATQRGGVPRIQALRSQMLATLRHVANDSRGVQVLQCAEPEADREGYDVRCDVRVRNEFGALVLQVWDFLVVRGRVLCADEGQILGDTIADACSR